MAAHNLFRNEQSDCNERGVGDFVTEAGERPRPVRHGEIVMGLPPAIFPSTSFCPNLANVRRILRRVRRGIGRRHARRTLLQRCRSATVRSAVYDTDPNPIHLSSKLNEKALRGVKSSEHWRCREAYHIPNSILYPRAGQGIKFPPTPTYTVFPCGRSPAGLRAVKVRILWRFCKYMLMSRGPTRRARETNRFVGRADFRAKVTPAEIL